MSRVRMNKEERKKQIQNYALDLFLSQGFKNTTMDEIREASGLSAGGLYHHYSSTYEILYDIMKDGSVLRGKSIQKTVESFGNTINPQIMAEIWVDKMIADNKYIPVYVMFLCEIKNDVKLNKLYKKIKAMTIQEFSQLLRKLNYIPPTEEEFDFLTNIINSSLLGCEILNARENYLKNREYLLLMLESYFAKIEKKGKEASIEK